MTGANTSNNQAVIPNFTSLPDKLARIYSSTDRLRKERHGYTPSSAVPDLHDESRDPRPPIALRQLAGAELMTGTRIKVCESIAMKPGNSCSKDLWCKLLQRQQRSEERRVGKECRSRWSP